MNQLDHSVPEAGDKSQFNLFISLSWCCCSLLSLLITAFSDETSATTRVSLPELLIAIVAIYGLSLFRWQSLSSLLTPEPKAFSIASDKSFALNNPITSFFGNNPKLRISWLSQSLGNLSLAVTLMATWKPVILAGLIAALLVGIEFAWAFARLYAQQTESNIPGSASRKDESCKAEAFTQSNDTDSYSATRIGKLSTVDSHASEPTLRASFTATPAHIAETDEEADIVDPNYTTLMALRDKIESPCDPKPSLEENTSLSPDSSTEIEASPLQTQRDYRDKTGLGRIAGELNILTQETSSPWIFTIGFMPPFKSLPEWIAECDSDVDVNIKVLQIQPVGVKLEIKADRTAELPERFTIHWEATLEST